MTNTDVAVWIRRGGDLSSDVRARTISKAYALTNALRSKAEGERVGGIPPPPLWGGGAGYRDTKIGRVPGIQFSPKNSIFPGPFSDPGWGPRP